MMPEEYSKEELEQRYQRLVAEARPKLEASRKQAEKDFPKNLAIIVLSILLFAGMIYVACTSPPWYTRIRRIIIIEP